VTMAAPGTAVTSQEEFQALVHRLDVLQQNYNEALDTMWMLLSTALVFMMHSGFSLLEAGSVRSKNTQNILGKNVLVVTVGFISWYVIGYGFAFGHVGGGSKFIGSTGFFMYGFNEDRSKFRKWLFQGTFCATGGTIVSGAMAERTKLKGFTIFTVLMTTLIYPCVVFWVWSHHGFLRYPNGAGIEVSIFGPAFMDFAGSACVHLCGGIAAFVGALIVGPRSGRFKGNEDQFDGHSVPFCVLGTFILFFGWYGFNPGSTMFMHDITAANKAAIVAVNTTLSPCISGMLVFFLRARVFQPKRLDVGAFCNGILAGLVSVTASCHAIQAWEAMLIGFFAAFVYQGASMLLPRFHIDDVVDAFAVHGANGLWGVLAAGLFGDPAEGLGGNGLFFGGDQFRVQLIGALIILGWSGGLSLLIFLPLRLIGFLRLSDEFQKKGADAMEHSPGKAYNTSGEDAFSQEVSTQSGIP